MVDPTALDRWAAEGNQMSLDQVVAYALGVPEEDLSRA
jgi:hypothetical protein